MIHTETSVHLETEHGTVLWPKGLRIPQVGETIYLSFGHLLACEEETSKYVQQAVDLWRLLDGTLWFVDRIGTESKVTPSSHYALVCVFLVKACPN